MNAKLTEKTMALADRAAMLAKADLLTDMVGEFPELQGVMGRYYAEHDGEPPTVAAAIEQHYWPRFAGDAQMRGICPPNKSLSAGAAPRYGTCVMSIFAAVFNHAAAR